MAGDGVGVGAEDVLGRKRAVRKDKGVRSPEKRRSPEHYARLTAAMFRTKRTRVLLRLLESTPPLTPEQCAAVLAAVQEIEVYREEDKQAS